MSLQAIVDRVKGILLQPHLEWEKIRGEARSNQELILYYVLPFAAVAALISFVVILSSTYLSIWIALRVAAYQLLLPVISVIVTAVVINELAETFNSTKELNNAFKLVTYSYTPVLLIGIITSLSWSLGWLGILGLYGMYLLWVGLPILMNTPEDKRLVYVIATAVVLLVIQLITSAILGVGRLSYY